MKGLLYFDATLPIAVWCNICGNKCKDGMAGVYKEGDTRLFFCDGADCRDEFLELNQMRDTNGK